MNILDVKRAIVKVIKKELGENHKVKFRHIEHSINWTKENIYFSYGSISNHFIQL